MAQRAVIGLAAHVDAGKTTLSESMLFLSGALRRQGRVDHGDVFLDTDRMEKERGITIFSKEARLTWKKTELTLVDTPGHTDFSGETERALGIMDAAVLVISAPEGVQSHTRTLWRLMAEAKLPVILFVNKMDYFQGNREALLSTLRQQLDPMVLPFPDPDPETVALCDEASLDAFLREGALPEKRIRALFRERKLFPCFFGSALKNEGVEPLMDFLAGCEPSASSGSAFGARVYKIARDPQGARLTFLKVTGGVLKVRDTLRPFTADGTPASAEESWAEKAAELRLYSGSRYTTVPQVPAGSLCCVVGLSKTRPGDGLGAAKGRREQTLRPCWQCRLIPPPGADLHYVLDCLQALEEEEPLIQVDYLENRREIRIQSMGDVYLEVLSRQLNDRYGLEVTFSESGVLYRETILEPVEGVGHYEPLRHYAEVHLLLEPLPAGSGLEFASAVPVDDLALNWQRLIMTHLREKVHAGVLTGSPITDMKITLTAGRAHLKHTEGGDFRQATYRALRHGLMRALEKSACRLLEPTLSLEITVPEENLGRVLSDLTRMGGSFESPEEAEDGMRRLTALAPASACASWGKELRIFTRGRGRLVTAFHAWQPCPDQEAVVADRRYDPLRDPFNSPDSVFCSHGAGYVVPWNEVERHMHLPSLVELRKRRASALGQPAPDSAPNAPNAPNASNASISPNAPNASVPPGSPRPGSQPYRGTAEEDAALERIFERTYGPGKARQLMTSPPRAAAENQEDSGSGAAGARETVSLPAPEILLVDGYNVLYAWEEWKPLMQGDLGIARKALADLLCNYAGATGHRVILVFDAYRVQGHPGSAEKYQNIFIIYTRQSQTADAFIEQTTYLARNSGRVRVVTSDQPEQLIAAGNAALRTSAREFREEVIRVRGSIAAFLEKNNRPGGEKSLERAYKEAWKKQALKKKETPDGGRNHPPV
ncbi:MAG: TetM/TetW/TetO/TetS family tetracycline resistance ribosomal protection protein [Clostridia bacterium]|nr:TetM/TetW/TetO/TetS family tetracycline resistance ribosomal protection protein [Clostridia bacterium]